MRRIMSLRPLSLATVLLAASTASAPNARAAAFPPPATIEWGTCPTDSVSGDFTLAFEGRLECGSMQAPLSYDEPERGKVAIGLIRVKAMEPTLREGSIFFNFGGPGGHPADFLPQLAASWNVADSASTLDGDKRRIAERFDMIAVVPRGLRGSPRLVCDTPLAADEIDPSVYLADWNWKGIVEDARNYAQRCSTQYGMHFAGTLAHVADMEYARLSLGEPVMNYFGISYGTWVGSYYAALFPEHMGRFVLDSTMDITSTFEEIHAGIAPDVQDLFERHIVRQVLTRPAFGVTEPDTTAVLNRLKAMPGEVRNVWMTQMHSAADLAAVLTMSRWIDEERQTWTDAAHWDTIGARLRTRAQGHRFSTVAQIDSDIHASVEDLIPLLEPGVASDEVVDVATYLAVVCGDTPWKRSIREWRTMANVIADKYPVKGGGSVVTGLTCRHWTVHKDNKPPLMRLAQAPPILMVQAEFDTSTPLAGARRTMEAMPSARMVVARTMIGHGVFGMSGTPCLERSVGRYLLTGEVPTERTTTCDFEPSPPSRSTRSLGPLPATAELREQLRRRLRRS